MTGITPDPKESPWVVTVPLILLAIPSVLAGWIAIEPLLFGGYFGSSIVVLPEHDVLGKLKEEWHGVGAFIAHGFISPVLWIAIAGAAVGDLPVSLQSGAAGPDRERPGRRLHARSSTTITSTASTSGSSPPAHVASGRLFSDVGDRQIIEGVVNGSARMVGWWGVVLRQMQSGYVYHYAFTMIIGLFALFTWWVVK